MSGLTPRSGISLAERFLRLRARHKEQWRRYGRVLPAGKATGAVIVLALGMFAGLSTACFADDGPKPYPSGIATGDKTTVVDAAGNSFVVA